MLYECRPREAKMAGRTRDLVKKRIRQGGGRGDERCVKKQRANDGRGTAGGGTMAEKLVFWGDKNVNLKIRR